MMIACAPFPPVLSAPPLGWLTRGSHLKLQDSTPLAYKRPLPPFHSCTPSSTSFLCECLSDQNGSYLQPTLASEVEIATTFIEDMLIDVLSQKNRDVRQIVLLTDGADDRPHRVIWPPMSLIFHVSSQSIIQDPKGANDGSTVLKSCLVRYIHADLEESAGLDGWTDRLRSAGYQGNKPSVWAIQGISLAAQKRLQKVLENISGMAMKGSLLIGELLSTKFGGLNEDKARLQQLEKILMGCGFRMKSSSYKQSSNASHEKHGSDGVHIVFVAEQLRLSDDQVKNVMREAELAEETGDEDTFEDWL